MKVSHLSIYLLILSFLSVMDYKHTIIQWNCRGLKPKFDEISLLLSQQKPSIFCLQETFLKPDDKISLKGFNIYNYIHSNCQRPSGGSSIFVKSSCPQRNIQLTTELQATAVSVTLDKEITICSIYIPPSFSLKTEHLDSLLKQLPSPYLLLGDFNGHNILWGNKENNSRGELIENFITNNDICLMNDKSNTLESPYHLVAVSGAHFTQGTILIVILVSSGSAKSRTHQSAVGGFLVTRRGWPGRLRACRIWTFINAV